MTTGIVQSAFTAGELAPSLYGRVDFDLFYKSLRTCRNMIVSKYGGVDNRPGTQFIAPVNDSTHLARLIPFQYNNQQTYVLELGNKTMRIIANGALLSTGDLHPVTNAEYKFISGPHAIGFFHVLTVPVHPFVTGQVVNITGVAPEVNGTFPVVVIDGNTLIFTGLPFTTTITWTGGGTVQLSGGGPVVVATPWFDYDLAQLKITQSADVITVCHPLYPTQQIERTGPITWVVTPFLNVNGPFRDINVDKNITVTASAVSGPGVIITSSQPLFTADMVGLEFYIQQSPDDTTHAWEVAKATAVNDIVIFGNNYYQAVSTGTTGTVGPTVLVGSERDGNPGILWNYLHSGFGIVKITAFTDSQHVVTTVISRLPDLLIPATIVVNIANVIPGNIIGNFAVQITTATPTTFVTGQVVTISGVVGTAANGTFTITVGDATNFLLNGNYDPTPYVSGGVVGNLSSPSYLWALPAWGSSQGFPGTTTYFQDRQLFGGTIGQPSNIWMSTTAGFTDFAVGNPILDSDAITYKVLSNQVNTIKHMMELTYLLIFTSGGIYMVQGGATGNGVVTPGTITLNFQGSNAISDVAPLRINNFALFIQQKGSQVRTLGFSFSENAFVGQDVTTMSNHLFEFWTLNAWTYQEIPYSCIWSVRSDGVLLGLTFNPEQQITGWHRHDTKGAFESVCCINENNTDTVYFIVKRTLNGQQVRCIERMAPRQFQDVRDAYFVDCGLTYDGRLINPATSLPFGTATVFSGLDYLDNETVSILADGIVYPQQVVVGGTVTLPNPSTVAHIGLPYTSDFETLDIATQRADIRDKKKAINAVSLIVDKSSGFLVGPDVDNLQPVTQRNNENYGAPTELISGLIDESITCGWDKKGRIFVRQIDPLPLSILAVIPQIEVAGN
jgi:hypothetical protein